MADTADLLAGADAVLTLGDTQYEEGTLNQFERSYDPTWGRAKSITYPAVGNHEYQTAGAAGYFAYFGARAAPPNGYYSFDLGGWHIVALNSNCSEVGGCGPGSPQGTWLRADLEANPARCTLAYWHEARFSSGGEHGSSSDTDAFWEILYEFDAEVVLSGHDHNYERFWPQSPSQRRDEARGIVQFVVGTGGKNLRSFGSIEENSAARNATSFGVLELTLRDASFDWRFLPAAGDSYRDAGSHACH